jgi:hypothetical protein
MRLLRIMAWAASSALVSIAACSSFTGAETGTTLDGGAEAAEASAAPTDASAPPVDAPPGASTFCGAHPTDNRSPPGENSIIPTNGIGNGVGTGRGAGGTGTISMWMSRPTQRSSWLLASIATRLLPSEPLVQSRRAPASEDQGHSWRARIRPPDQAATGQRHRSLCSA